MTRHIPPIESMRPGGLPAWSPVPPERALRHAIDDSEWGDASEAYPPRRTCRCGQMVLVPSEADEAHRAACGEPDEPEPETAVPESRCKAPGCGLVINYGATYCSHRCQVAHTRKRGSRLNVDGQPD